VQKTGWIHAWAAVNTVRVQFSEFEYAARMRLEEAICSGTVRARMDGKALAVNECRKMADREGGFPSRGMELSRASFLKWLKDTAPSPKDERGRKPKDEWEYGWAEICRLAHDGALPQHKPKLVAHLQEWFLETYGEEPAKSSIQQRVDLLWEALGRK